MKSLIWTSATPTESGWYWRRDPYFPEQPDIVYVRVLGGKAVDVNKWPFENIYEWAGPIRSPKEKPVRKRNPRSILDLKKVN